MLKVLRTRDFTLKSHQDRTSGQGHKYLAFVYLKPLGGHLCAIRAYPSDMVQDEYKKADKQGIVVFGPVLTFSEAKHLVQEHLTLKLNNLKDTFEQLMKIKPKDVEYTEVKHN